MRLLGNFSFVKSELGRSKDNKDFLVVSLLDENRDSCRFFVYDKDLIDYIRNANLDFNESVLCCLDVSYFSDSWRVNLKELTKDNK